MKVKCEGRPCTNCRNHQVECTFNPQTRKRTLRKDNKYIARIEERVRKLEDKFSHAAPEAWAAFENEEEDRKSPGHGIRRGISRSERVGEGSDPSHPRVPPSSYLVAGSGAYIGTALIPYPDGRPYLALDIFGGYKGLCRSGTSSELRYSHWSKRRPQR